jgi:cytochrome bd-type quinol oxidase subunit 2
MYKLLFTFLCVCLFHTITLCQDLNGTTIGPPDEEEKWYSQPWVWIAGAILLILLLITILKSTKPTRSIADEDRISKVVGTEDKPDTELDR